MKKPSKIWSQSKTWWDEIGASPANTRQRGKSETRGADLQAKWTKEGVGHLTWWPAESRHQRGGHSSRYSAGQTLRTQEMRRT